MGQDIATRDDGFAVSERGGTNLIKGIIVKFADRTYKANKTETLQQAPHGPAFVVVGIVTAWVHWENGKPTHKITRTGQNHPWREDMGDLDQAEWPLGIGGVPSDPHRDSRYVYLINLRSGKTYTFITDTYGGRQAVGELKDACTTVRQVRPNALPVVQLAAECLLLQIDDRASSRVRLVLRQGVERSGRSIGDRPMAANHTKLIGLGVGAVLAISAAPMYAAARHPSADTLKAEARNFVKIISGDKRKSQTYCKIVELNDQIDEKEDPIDARKLKKKRNKLEEKLGRKYIALVAGVMNIDRDSRDYRAIASILEPLDKLCTAIKNQSRQTRKKKIFGTPISLAGPRRYAPTQYRNSWEKRARPRVNKSGIYRPRSALPLPIIFPDRESAQCRNAIDESPQGLSNSRPSV